MNLAVEFVSQNLVTTSNFVEFRDSRNVMFFKAQRVVGDTWHTMSVSQCATCQVQDASNNELKWGHKRHVAPWDWMEIHSRWIKR